MSNQAGGVEVERDVAFVHALIHLGDDVSVDSVVTPVTFAAGKISVDDVFVRGQVMVEYNAVGLPVLGSDLMAWAVTAGEWCADEFVLWVVVGSEWVVAGIHIGKALGALAVFALGRVSETKKVDVQIAFAVMHPVVVLGELAVELAVLGPLPGDAIPDASSLVIEPIIATEDIQEGELHEALVRIIAAVHARPLVAPNQGAVRPHIAVNIFAGSAVERIDELALLDGPCGDSDWGVDMIDWIAHSHSVVM